MTTPFKLIILSFFLFMSVSPVLAQSAGAEQDFPKKKAETKMTEVITTDSLPASELMKRATNWLKSEGKNYIKTKTVASGSKAECEAVFLTKPKELNPQVDYNGRISMKVVIECKDSKYRYTVSEIKHSSKSGKTSAGNVDNIVPECGSMAMDDITWKKLKGECLRNANQVVADIKEGMTKDSATTGTTDEW